MYLTAQRPAAAESYEWPGINAYLYLHNQSWMGSPPAAMPAARLERSHELLARLPGREIRSYLDLIGPDDATDEELDRAVSKVIGAVSEGGARPWER
jgi:hypothetical protein